MNSAPPGSITAMCRATNDRAMRAPASPRHLADPVAGAKLRGENTARCDKIVPHQLNFLPAGTAAIHTSTLRGELTAETEFCLTKSLYSCAVYAKLELVNIGTHVNHRQRSRCSNGSSNSSRRPPVAGTAAADHHQQQHCPTEQRLLLQSARAHPLLQQ